MRVSAEVSEADLLRALTIAARVVEEYGEVFLPLFLRLEQEAAAIQQRQSAVERARAISQQHRSPQRLARRA